MLGGGIVGTFCAGLLARRGFHVELFESAEPGQTTWRGIINMNAQAVRLLQEADPALLRAVLDEHKQAGTATFWDSGLKTEILTYDIATESQRFALPPYMITCERSRFLEQLRESLPAAVRVRTGQAITAVEESDAGVRLSFEDGTSARADYLIGADGIKSLTRRSIFSQYGGLRPPEWTGHFTITGIAQGVELPENASADQTELWGGSGRFLIFRGRNHTVFWGVLIAGHRPEHTESGDRVEYQHSLLAFVRERFVGYHSVVEELLAGTELSSLGAFDMNEVSGLSRWSTKRVLLLGDAAHAMCNDVGSGGCTGMEDAWVTAETLALCMRAHAADEGETNAIARAFKLIERRRMPRAKRIQFESFLLAQLTVVHCGKAWRFVRDAVLRWIGKQPEHDRLPIFDWLCNYRSTASMKLPRREV